MINYKNIKTLKKYLRCDFSIRSRKENNVTLKQQKLINKHVKIARFIGLIPYLDTNKLSNE
ncbi:hypothetical protein ACWNYH_00540 [Candidatus Vidania fulgoroideorum]